MTIKQQWIAGGVDGLYVGFYDNDGLFTGGHGTLAKGEQSWMQRWQAVKNLAPSIPEQNRTTITGDDRSQGFLVYDRTDSPTLGIQTANRQQALESEMVGLKDYARNQNRTLLLDPLIDQDVRQQLYLTAHAQAKANAYGEVTQPGWVNMEFWKGEMSSGSPTGLEEQTGHAADFTFTFERQSTYPDNVALSAANEGTTQASGNIWSDSYRRISGAFYGDGTLTQINLPKTPAADHTNTDIYAVEITKRTAAGVVSLLTPTTDYTVSRTPAYVTLLSPAEDNSRYVVNLKY